MIVKELDAFPSTADPRERAGRAAEEQMAFYLRRAFAAADVRVFNGIRLEHAGDAAQVDHLILHKWGMVVIESKSVTTRVKINAQGEWTRWQEGRWRGMSSPVLQAQRQADFLRARLRENVASLLDKKFGLQVGFGAMPLDVLVAISDGGMIERGAGVLLQVYKADQVCLQVQSLVEAYRKSSGVLGLLIGKEECHWHTLKAEETARLMQFLRHQHRPLHTASAPPMMQPFASQPPQNSLSSLSERAPVQNEALTHQAARAEFNADTDPVSVSGTVSAAVVCATCGRTVSVGVARYCREHAGRFGARIYCMTCQRSR